MSKLRCYTSMTQLKTRSYKTLSWLSVIAIVLCMISIQASATTNPSPTQGLTARATEWLNRLRAGNWDWKQFGPGPDDTPRTPTLRYIFPHSFRKLLSTYGSVKSMQYMDQRYYVSDEGHQRTAYRYRVIFEHGRVVYTFAEDSDGFVGGFMIDTDKLNLDYSR